MEDVWVLKTGFSISFSHSFASDGKLLILKLTPEYRTSKGMELYVTGLLKEEGGSR